MIQKSCQKHHLKRIALFAGVIFIFAGTLNNLIADQIWYVVYLRDFVFTATCTTCCTFLICRFFTWISQYSRIVFGLLFAGLVVVGILAGVIIGTLILDQRLVINPRVFGFSLLIGFMSSVIITAYMIFRENLELQLNRIKEIELENERLQRYESEARLSSLQAKLNPHFLFNILNSTAALIYEDPLKAEQSIIRLSEIYRTVMAFSNQRLIALGEEIKLIEDLLELEKLRFEDQLSYRIHCPAALKNHPIPGLLIEPLVENVIKHVHGETGGNIQIEIEIQASDTELAICVRDNGPGFDVTRVDLGFGLYSIQERLRLLFAEQAGLEIDSGPDRGTTVKLWFPFETKPIETANSDREVVNG